MKEIINLKESTTEFVLRSSSGNVKPLWNPNRIGRWILRQFGADVRLPLFGAWRESLLTHNLITTVGHAAANGRISGQGSYGAFVNIAIGIGTTAAAIGDTALQSEITSGGGSRGVATASQVTTTTSNDTTQLVKTFTFTSSFAVTEEGILDQAVTLGTLLAHQVFAAINVANTDTLQITHKIQT